MTDDSIPGLLAAVERRWAAMTSPLTVEAVLARGATEEQLADAELALGGPLHADARAFWQWHDGIPNRDWRTLPFLAYFNSVAEMVDETLRLREVRRESVTPLDMPEDFVVWGSQRGAKVFLLIPKGSHCNLATWDEGEFADSGVSFQDGLRTLVAVLSRAGWRWDGRTWVPPYITADEYRTGLL